jgi:hypothetical protein
MNASIEFLEGASLGVVKTRPDQEGPGLAYVFELKTPSETFGFDVQVRYAANGNDYSVLIGHFGRSV